MPSSSVCSTMPATRSQVSLISLMYFAFGSPAARVSAIATGTFPPSLTTWPRDSSLASSPATRTAEGPMSTPRRDCPRSRGTPRMRIWRGGRDWTPPCKEPAARGRSVEIRFPSLAMLLGVDPVESPREWDGLAHMLQAADPGHHALDAHAEAGVGDRTVAAQIQVPGKSFEWQLVLLDPLLQQIVGGDT